MQTANVEIDSSWADAISQIVIASHEIYGLPLPDFKRVCSEDFAPRVAEIIRFLKNTEVN
jgi:hypothetical protein